jgi:hypothetical protein
MPVACLGDHQWKAVQGLGTEHHIDERRTLAQGLAFLTGDTTADTDDQGGILLLEFTPLSLL